MAQVVLAKTASVPTPSTGNVGLFADTTANALMKFTNEGGVTQQLVDDTNPAIFVTGTKTFANGTLLVRNPAGTYAYTITPAAIAAARALTLPLTTGADTLAALGVAQTRTAIQTFTTPVLGAATGTSVVLTGAITSSGTAGIGYAAGAGGTVTQLTSKVTAFTLSKICGTIQFAGDALGADTSSAGAVWTNTTIAATDIIVFQHISGGTIGAYNVTANAGGGSATIYIRNLTPGSLTEAPVFRFAVIKTVIA